VQTGTVIIGVANEFIREWLHTKYHKVILKALRDVVPDTRAVEYVISKKKPEAQPLATPQQESFRATLQKNELPLKEVYVNRDTNLNPRYTFDTFIIGPFNELAYSATQAILKKPGVYNPLYIYGETGLGKTHLIQAIGNELCHRYPGSKVYYVTSEKFTNELVSALHKGTMDAFKNKYRKYDTLIIDDIQFVSGKEKTQEELFHVFNALHDNNHQIIFSSDKHPHYIIGLEDRLKSRFSAGMVIDINKPEYESRLTLIASKARALQLHLDMTCIEYLAKNIEGNIREIEGSLNNLLCQRDVKGHDLSLEELKEIMKNTVKSKKQISAQDVVHVVSQFYNLDHILVYEKTRRKEVVKMRQIIMYLLREDFNVSFPHIGRELGGRDHTTVIHSCAKIKSELETDPTLIQELEQIRSMLTTY
jgi:chromosomal replication initiator protein